MNIAILEAGNMVTILIPCYNGEKYIRRCLESCLKQTYKNIKIVIVNDGSTDNSENIIKEYIKENKNIKLINQKNKGISSTRNILLKNLKTKYGYFLDADDWIDDFIIEDAMNNIKDNDLLVNSYLINDCKKCKEFYIGSKINIKTNKESYLNNNIPFVWGILFDKKIFDNHKFCEESQFFEDAAIMWYLIYKNEKVAFIRKPGYHYFVNRNSLSRSNKMNYNKIYSAIIQLKNFYNLIKKEKFKNLPRAINDQLAFCHCVIFTYIQFQSKITRQEKKVLKNNLKYLEKENFKLSLPKRYWKKWYFILYRLFLY